MAKVLLILPPWYLFLGTASNEIPSGLCSLAGHLNKNGHEAWVYDADVGTGSRSRGFAGELYRKYDDYETSLRSFTHPIWKAIKSQVEAVKPDIVGVHFKTGAFESVRQTARIVRQVSPESLIVVGGPHASLMPYETAAMAEFDIVVRGEGEETLLDLANRMPFEFKANIPGAIYRDKSGSLVDGGSRKLIDDLNCLGAPDREHLLNSKRYGSMAFGAIFTARGCPFSCTFCSSKKIWTQRVRYRSPESIVEEIVYVRKKFGTHFFNFQDDTFTLSRARTVKTCELIARKAGRIAWKCDTRADCIDSELARIMRKAGCVQANVGIESGSERLLSMIKKGETLQQISSGIKHLQSRGISVSAYLMIGFPTETEHEIEATMQFASNLNPDFLVLSVLAPYPGTEIYEQARACGRMQNDVPYSAYFHQSPLMGISDVEPSRFNEIKARVLGAADRNNGNLLRKMRRLALVFRQSPAAATERLWAYLLK